MTTPTPPTELELADATVRWLDALLTSASVEKIGKDRWWERAEDALAIAADAPNIRAAVSSAARILQVEVTNPATDDDLMQACAVIERDYPAWQAQVQLEGVYLVATTRIHRTSRRAQRKDTTR